MSKPIDLIVANVMHETLPDWEKFKPLFAVVDKVAAEARKAGHQVATLGDPMDDIARKLLCEISHDARMPVIWAALKAAGAPASVDDIREGLQAGKDRTPA